MEIKSELKQKSAALAREALREIQGIELEQETEVLFPITSNQQQPSIKLPVGAFRALVEVLEQMAKGREVEVIARATYLTTQQAADLLGVSRPYLIKLLDKGEIAFDYVGSHRRIRAEDFIAYKEADDERRREAADELAREAQELGLGY